MDEVDSITGVSEARLASESKYKPSFKCIPFATSLEAFVRDLDMAAARDESLVVDASVFYSSCF